MKQLESNIVDLVVSDPPYFEYVTGHRKDKTSKLSKPFAMQSQEDQVRVIQECLRVLKPDSAIFVFTNWENIHWLFRPFQGIWRNMIIWDKGNWTAGDLKGSFGNQYEVILLGVKGKWQYRGKREPDIWAVPRVGTDRIHPTEKPVALYEKIILNSTDAGDLVLDPYGGSGSSVEACIKTGRHCIAYEIDKEFHDLILRRVKNVQMPLLPGRSSS